MMRASVGGIDIPPGNPGLPAPTIEPQSISSALVANCTDYLVPVSHNLKMLLSREPSLIVWISWISSEDRGFDLREFHAARACLDVVFHDGDASFTKRSGKSIATGVA